MNFRWLKRYSVAMQPSKLGTARKILMEEKVLQILDSEGKWRDVPVVIDKEGYEIARVVMNENKPWPTRTESLEADLEEAAENLASDED